MPTGHLSNSMSYMVNKFEHFAANLTKFEYVWGCCTVSYNLNNFKHVGEERAVVVQWYLNWTIQNMSICAGPLFRRDVWGV